MITLTEDGYPTDDFLEFIKDYKNQIPILEFLKILKDGWYFNSWGFVLQRKFKGIKKLELHTGGWSGNKETIDIILNNIYLTHFDMIYYKWVTGGHYYFNIKIKN